jgi:hypothetical protein
MAAPARRAPQGIQPGDFFALYSGTAALDLRALDAPALRVITRINEMTAPGTRLEVLYKAPGWDEREAKQWLAPLGTAAASIDDMKGHVAGLTFFPMTMMTKWYSFGAGKTCEYAALSARVVELLDPKTVETLVGQADSPAFRAFKELGCWLEATDEEIATMAGVGRTTPYTWLREGREPRRSTVRSMFQTHAALAALVQRLGEPDAIRWLVHDEPSRRERLLAGDLASVQTEMRPVIFARSRRRTRPGSWVPDNDHATD